jgi:hypothetical protein
LVFYIYIYILKIFRISSPFPHHIYIYTYWRYSEFPHLFLTTYIYICIDYYIEDISNNSIFNWSWFMILSKSPASCPSSKKLASGNDSAAETRWKPEESIYLGD